MARHRKPADSEDELPPVPITQTTLAEAGRLARYLLPYRTKFILALLSLLVGSLFTLAFPYLAGALVNAALSSLQGKSSDAWTENVNTVALVLIGVRAVQAILAF